jgi:hypothetical protein
MLLAVDVVDDMVKCISVERVCNKISLSNSGDLVVLHSLPPAAVGFWVLA